MGRIAERFFPFFAICGMLRTPQMAILNSHKKQIFSGAALPHC